MYYHEWKMIGIHNNLIIYKKTNYSLVYFTKQIWKPHITIVIFFEIYKFIFSSQPFNS